jgi:hypothetical protein
MMKPLAITLSVAERRVKRGDIGSDLINTQCKLIQNCNNEPHPNKYILIKVKKVLFFPHS